MSGLVAGLYVTRVISMVTDQHGASDSSTLQALGSHEKVDSYSKERGKNQGIWMCSPLPCGVLVMKFPFIYPVTCPI